MSFRLSARLLDRSASTEDDLLLVCLSRSRLRDLDLDFGVGAGDRFLLRRGGERLRDKMEDDLGRCLLGERERDL